MKILVFGGGSDLAQQIYTMQRNTILVEHDACDISRPKSVKKFIQAHKPEVVINCAGLVQSGLVKQQDFEDWKNQVFTNLIGSFNIAQAATNNDVKTIILVGSVTGLFGKPKYSAYSAAKAGVISLVQSLGMEGINAYCVSPARIDTKMRNKEFPNEDKRSRLTTHDVAKVIFDCINGKYRAGDNVIILKRKFRKITRVDSGQPWKEYLNIKPYETAKTI